MQSKQLLEDRELREQDYADLLKRTQADFRNYRNRVEKEKEEQSKCATSDLVMKLLPVLDDFQRAREAMPVDAARADWARGVDIIEKKLTAILKEEGLTRIEAEGRAFNPEEHEALSFDESNEYEEGIVKGVYANGYRLNGRVVRPAQVAVSRGNKKAKINVRRRRPERRTLWPEYRI